MISAGAFVAAGYALSYWLTFAFAYVDSSAAWRAPVAFQIIFSLPAIALLFFLPEVRENALLAFVKWLTKGSVTTMAYPYRSRAGGAERVGCPKRR